MKLSDRSLSRYKATGKKTGYIRVWKCVIKGPTHYRGYVWERFYKKGFAHAKQRAVSEQQLIHAFRSQAAAKNYQRHDTSHWENVVVIQCIVKPQWVMAIGLTSLKKKTLTTKAIVMPAYPKTRVTVAEFRAAIKGKKIQKYSWEKI